MLEPTSPKFIEFSSRCDRIRQRMQAEKIDGLFIMQPGDDTVIEKGFCLSIKPAVYMTGKWGIEIEDSVHVTKEGWEYLTEAAPSEL
ncbi:MAG: hypothetical protein JOZ30_00790, partial [Hyphomicrobiales bacterium]|nr:hypothetical protein [Hyphomicrobiales bacterium]